MKPQWCSGTASGDKGKVCVCSKASFISFSSGQERAKSSSLPPLESATAAGWGTAGLCSRRLYNVLPLCSPGGSSLLLGHTMQAEDIIKYWNNNSSWIESHTHTRYYITSHMCPTIGASAQECSTLIPIFPLGYETSVKDLSNHLREERAERMETAPDVLQPFTTSPPTCHNTFHVAGIWRSCQESGSLRGRNPAAHHRESGRRQPSR